MSGSPAPLRGQLPRGGQTFILVTLHVRYGKGPERGGELKAIAHRMKDWARETDDFDQNLMVLGDFNIDPEDDRNGRAFRSTGLRPPAQLDGLTRTIFEAPGAPTRRSTSIRSPRSPAIARRT
jgi:endonuclease/exonuclease/phosphatase family metal-dependent hydrolase